MLHVSCYSSNGACFIPFCALYQSHCCPHMAVYTSYHPQHYCCTMHSPLAQCCGKNTCSFQKWSLKVKVLFDHAPCTVHQIIKLKSVLLLLILLCNWTEWGAIWSEIIHAISKSNERAARVWFEITSMISDQNCTTLSWITTSIDHIEIAEFSQY